MTTIATTLNCPKMIVQYHYLELYRLFIERHQPLLTEKLKQERDLKDLLGSNGLELGGELV